MDRLANDLEDSAFRNDQNNWYFKKLWEIDYSEVVDKNRLEHNFTFHDAIFFHIFNLARVIKIMHEQRTDNEFAENILDWQQKQLRIKAVLQDTEEKDRDKFINVNQIREDRNLYKDLIEYMLDLD